MSKIQNFFVSNGRLAKIWLILRTLNIVLKVLGKSTKIYVFLFGALKIFFWLKIVSCSGKNSGDGYVSVVCFMLGS